MSDLNDLIHTNARLAYNNGYQDGIRQERERILELVNRHSELEELNKVVNPREVVITEVLKEVILED